MGCRTQIVEPKVPITKAVLIATRVEGKAQIEFETKEGEIYTVMFADRRSPSPRWRPLPGAENLVGTGGTMKLTDVGPNRRYRLRLHSINP